MQEAFRHGGWGMYPTLLVVIWLLVTAGRFAFAPARDKLPSLIGLGVLTLFISIFNFVKALIHVTVNAADIVDTKELMNAVVVGVGESLHNLALGFLGLTLAALLLVIGLLRSRAKSATVVAIAGST